MKFRQVYGSHDRPDRFFIDGREVTKEEHDRQFEQYRAALPQVKDPHDGSALAGWKPIHSDALACNPNQVPEMEAEAKRRGVPTEHDGEGRPVLTSRSHRRDYMRAFGFFDRHGGYGDG
jgi:hypothetical protein